MRSILKVRTSASHAKVDRAVSALCLSDRAQYLTFLRTHQLAYHMLEARVPARSWVATLLSEVRETLDADLLTMRADTLAAPMIGGSQQLNPLGVAYVVCGSHFGKKVLRKRWARSTDQQVRAAGCYLANEVLTQGWQRWMTEIGALGDPPRDFQRMGEDADRTFEVFCDCLAAVRQWERTAAAA